MNKTQRLNPIVTNQRWLFWLCLALLLALLAGCARKRTPVTCSEIPVGIIIAGDELDEAQEQREGYEMALQEINQAGGVQSCPLRLIYNTSDGREASPENVQAGLLDLSDQGVIAILGATTNDGSKHLAAIAGYTRTPVLIVPDTADDLEDNSSAWVFRINPANEAYAADIFDLAYTRLNGNAGVAVLYEHTEYGEAAAVVAGKAALDQGLNILLYQGYASSTKDYAASLQAAVDAHANVVYIINSVPEQAQAILTTIQEKKLSFEMVVGSGAGFTARSSLYTNSGELNQALGQVIIPMAWSRELPWKGSAGFEAALKTHLQADGKQSAIPAGVRSAQAYSGLWILANAMQMTPQRSIEEWNQILTNSDLASAYRGELAEALRSFHAGQYESLLGPVEFDSAGRNKVDGVLVQAKDGKLVTIYPVEYTGEKQ